MYRSPHAFAIRANTDSTSSNTTKIIIIATCASVGGIVLSLLLFRLLRRCCRRAQLRPAPLPPVQPLARQRERQVSQFFDRNADAAARPCSWYDSTHLPPHALHPTGSAVSLLPGYDDTMTPVDSFVAGESPSPHTQRALPLPNPSFHNGTTSASPSSSSLGSNETHPLPSQTPETTHSVTSSSLSNSTTGSPRPPRSRSRSTPRSTHVRPVSMASSVSTAYTTRSRGGMNAIRGTPHGPHSSVQIILPTPLAPRLNPYLVGQLRSSSYSTADSTSSVSVADKWAMPAARRTPSEALQVGSRKRSTSTPATSRTSTSSLSSGSHFIHPPQRSSRHASPPSIYQTVAPPVPRIPPVYNASGSNVSLIEEPVERGRPRTTSLSLKSPTAADPPLALP